MVDSGRVSSWAEFGAMMCPVGMVVFIVVTGILTFWGVAFLCLMMAAIVLREFRREDERMRGVLRDA